MRKINQTDDLYWTLIPFLGGESYMGVTSEEKGESGQNLLEQAQLNEILQCPVN